MTAAVMLRGGGSAVHCCVSLRRIPKVQPEMQSTGIETHIHHQNVQASQKKIRQDTRYARLCRRSRQRGGGDTLRLRAHFRGLEKEVRHYYNSSTYFQTVLFGLTALGSISRFYASLN